MRTHEEMLNEWKQDPDYLKAYHALDHEFSFFLQLTQARHQAGLTQEQIAERMGTTATTIARLESGGGKKRHSPTISTLRKYASALGCQLEIKLIPKA